MSSRLDEAMREVLTRAFIAFQDKDLKTGFKELATNLLGVPPQQVDNEFQKLNSSMTQHRSRCVGFAVHHHTPFVAQE